MAITDITAEILIDPNKVEEAFADVHATPFDDFRRAELAAIGQSNPLLEHEIKLMFGGVVGYGQDLAYRMMTGQLAGHHVLAACTEGEMPRIRPDRIKTIGDAVLNFPKPQLNLSAEEREAIEPSITQIFRAEFDVSQVLVDLCDQLTNRQSKEGMNWMFMIFKPFIRQE